MHFDRYLRYWARERPYQIALSFKGQTLNWQEANEQAERLATALRSMGLKPDDRFGCLLPNGLEWCVAFYAALKTGAIFVPLNPHWSAPDLQKIAHDADCEIVLSTPRLYAELGDASSLPEDEAFLLGRQSKPLSYTAALKVDDTRTWTERPDSDILTLCYTSGSTGTPKGAVFTHAAIEALYIAKGVVMGWTSKDKFLVVLPLASTGGIIGSISPALIFGSRCFIEETFEPERTLDLIADHGVSVFSGGQMFWERLCRLPQFASAELSGLKHGQIGGAKIPLWLLEEWRKKGVVIRQGYGCTEMAGWMALQSEQDVASKPGTCGLPLPLSDIQIRSADGAVRKNGDVGEIFVHGPQMMKGYWRKPELTQKAIMDGWFCTGDLGFFDEAGVLVVIDKADNVIHTRSGAIYPAEVEIIISAFPGVEEVAVVGVGEVTQDLVAIVYARDAKANDILMRARRSLDQTRAPQKVHVVDQPLPRTPSGKIARLQLSKLFESAH
jgi:fatty-acyl-CoA synthase